MTHRLQYRIERLEQVASPPPPLRVVLLTEQDTAPDDTDVFVIRLVGKKRTPPVKAVLLEA